MESLFTLKIPNVDVTPGLFTLTVLAVLGVIIYVLNEIAKKYVYKKIEDMINRFINLFKRKSNAEQELKAELDSNEILTKLLRKLLNDFVADRVVFLRFKNHQHFLNEDSIIQISNSNQVLGNNFTPSPMYNEILLSAVYENYIEYLKADITEYPDFITTYDKCTPETCSIIKKQTEKKCKFNRRVLIFDIDKMPICNAKYIFNELGIKYRIQTTVFDSENKYIIGLLCIDYHFINDEDKELFSNISKFNSELDNIKIPQKLLNKINYCDLCEISHGITEHLRRIKKR